MTVLRPFVATGAFSPVSDANDLKRPMNSAFVALPRYASACGVRFGRDVAPPRPLHLPAARVVLSRAGAFPCRRAACDIRGSPRRPRGSARIRCGPSSGRERDTGPSSGLGSSLTRRFTGKSSFFAGTACFTGRERPDVSDDRLRVLVRDQAVRLVRHHREERVAVPVHALAHRAEHLAVRPRAEAVLGVGRDVLGADDAGDRELLAEREAALPGGARLERQPVAVGLGRPSGTRGSPRRARRGTRRARGARASRSIRSADGGRCAGRRSASAATAMPATTTRPKASDEDAPESVFSWAEIMRAGSKAEA